MSRIEAAFEELRRAGRGGLIAYITAGDPDPQTSLNVLVSISRAGADVLEVGVPFSDPLADGPVIQRATERALAAGMTLRGALDLIRRAREEIDTPIVLFTYANPILRMRPDVFAKAAADAGADGVLVLDYPLEEAGALWGTILDAGLDPILLVSPTTTDERIRQSAQLGRGFLYVISRLGVTGARDDMAGEIGEFLARVRQHAALPLALGFGISGPEQVAQACRHADAAVVGSALVEEMARQSETDTAERAGDYVRWLKSAL
jgi:tryptophan synthase alpha chain